MMSDKTRGCVKTPDGHGKQKTKAHIPALRTQPSRPGCNRCVRAAVAGGGALAVSARVLNHSTNPPI